MIVEAITQGKLDEARELVRQRLTEIAARKLLEVKKMLGARITHEIISEGPRFKIVRARIRKGKVQRRKKVSNLPAYTFRKKGKGGVSKLIRMSVQERRKRRMGQKRGKIKRRAKRAIIKQKYARSMRKRKALGIK